MNKNVWWWTTFSNTGILILPNSDQKNDRRTGAQNLHNAVRNNDKTFCNIYNFLKIIWHGLYLIGNKQYKSVLAACGQPTQWKAKDTFGRESIWKRSFLQQIVLKSSTKAKRIVIRSSQMGALLLCPTFTTFTRYKLNNIITFTATYRHIHYFVLLFVRRALVTWIHFLLP